jgi:molybdopterin-containing oxidoreductase family membrane subunit
VSRWTPRPLEAAMQARLTRLLAIMVATAAYFVLVYHLTNLYITERHGVEAFILRDGGIYTTLFWVGQIIVGSLIPLVLFYHPTLGKNRNLIGLGAFLVILGGLAQLYVLLIGGQAYPLEIFSGYEVLHGFNEGVINSYAPTIYEITLGVGGVAFALALVTVAIKALRFMPESLADDAVDTHH